jgi:nucleotide-binding universal stress UspA family protein
MGTTLPRDVTSMQATNISDNTLSYFCRKPEHIHPIMGVVSGATKAVLVIPGVGDGEGPRSRWLNLITAFKALELRWGAQHAHQSAIPPVVVIEQANHSVPPRVGILETCHYIATPLQYEHQMQTHERVSTMAYRDIIVYLDPTPDTDNRLKFAVDLAASHGARLIGVNACSVAAFEGLWRDRAVGLADGFESAIKERGIRGVYHDVDRTEKGGLQYFSHHADLIIAPQPEFEARDLIMAEIPEDVLLTVGVPVLMLPYGWKPRAIGESIVIAWKSSREATRAVHDSMPLLLKAKKVTVFTFAPESGVFGKEPDLLVNHLREHSVSATASSWPVTGDMSAVDALFASLDELDADLIVAGAYGHSRLFEGLFGGVSRDLLRQPSMPILMSH